MVDKILVDKKGGAALLDMSPAKFDRLRREDPAFPRGVDFEGHTKYFVEELRRYADSRPRLAPGDRGLRGERPRRPVRLPGDDLAPPHDVKKAA
jgi:hypothetical protein